jgi:uncharacterized membrane-anchored protein
MGKPIAGGLHVPAATLALWIIKILATTLGENRWTFGTTCP